MVDSTGDGMPDILFSNLLTDAESLRTDPNRMRAAVLAMKDVLEGLNEEL